jgi:hypothetical protein
VDEEEVHKIPLQEEEVYYEEPNIPGGVEYFIAYGAKCDIG